MMPASYSSAAYNPDQLIAGDADDLIGEKVTLISGQNLLRGAVIGKITASGKYTLSAAAAGDGSQTPDFILAEDCDATSGDKQALAYNGGHFIAEKVILGAGHTIASVKEGLRVKNIILVTTIGA
jgi:Bacteriophage lambda head decoration protein D